MNKTKSQKVTGSPPGQKNRQAHPRFFVSDFESVDGDVDDDPLLVLARGLDGRLQLQQRILEKFLSQLYEVNFYGKVEYS